MNQSKDSLEEENKYPSSSTDEDNPNSTYHLFTREEYATSSREDIYGEEFYEKIKGMPGNQDVLVLSLK